MLWQQGLGHSQMFAYGLHSGLELSLPFLPGALQIFPCMQEAKAKRGNIPISEAGTEEKEMSFLGYQVREGPLNLKQDLPTDSQEYEARVIFNLSTMSWPALLIITGGSSGHPWSLWDLSLHNLYLANQSGFVNLEDLL